MKRRPNNRCACGSDRKLLKPSFLNQFKSPKWICVSKGCKFNKFLAHNPHNVGLEQLSNPPPFRFLDKEELKYKYRNAIVFYTDQWNPTTDTWDMTQMINSRLDKKYTYRTSYSKDEFADYRR